MDMVFDQAQDRNGQEFHRLTSLFGCPDFVKEATTDNLCGDDNTEPHMFADMSQRRWACHTAPATYASALFFFDKKAQLNDSTADPIQERILASASFFGIEDQVQALGEKVKQANIVDEDKLEDVAFAIVMKFEDGRTDRKYPMRNTVEVMKAAEYLQKYRDNFCFSDRNKIADKILQKSSEFGATLGAARNEIEKMAGCGACSSKEAAELVRSRITALGWPRDGKPLQVELEKLANEIEQNPNNIQHHSTLIKLAETIDMVDQENKLVNNYDKSLERPEEVIFGVTKEAVASIADDLIGSSITGTFYKIADLEKLSVEDLGDALGEDFVSAISTGNAWVDTEKLAQIVPTLPRNDMELFEAVAANAGIAPFATKTAEAQQISAKDIQMMAAAHGSASGSLWNQIK